MPWNPPAYGGVYAWHDAPSRGTPLDEVHLDLAEQNLADHVDAVATSLAAYTDLHIAATTAVHGIADTSRLVLLNGSGQTMTQNFTVAPAAGVALTLVTPAGAGGRGFVVNEASSGKALVEIENITRGGTSQVRSAAIILSGDNGVGGNGRAWVVGIDDAADLVGGGVANADLAISKMLPGGVVSDDDGLYGTNAGVDGSNNNIPSTFAFGLPQPGITAGVAARLKLRGGSVTQGALALLARPLQTADMLNVASVSASQDAFRIKADGSTAIRTSGGGNVSASDFAITSASPTITSASYGFTSEDVGRYITSGSGVPAGTYISAVTNSTTATMSQNATATATGLTITVYGRVFQVRTAGDVPMLTAFNASGVPAVRFGVNVGIGPGVATPPSGSLLLALSQTGTTDAQMQISTPSNGSLSIIAKGAAAQAVIQTANNSDLILGSNATTRLTINKAGGFTVADANDFALGTATGSKFGTATNQKLAFYNSAPIVQPSAVGTATGYAAGATVATFHSDDTYTGNVGSTAYTFNGVVAALKNLGLLAA